MSELFESLVFKNSDIYTYERHTSCAATPANTVYLLDLPTEDAAVTCAFVSTPEYFYLVKLDVECPAASDPHPDTQATFFGLRKAKVPMTVTPANAKGTVIAKIPAPAMNPASSGFGADEVVANLLRAAGVEGIAEVVTEDAPVGAEAEIEEADEEADVAVAEEDVEDKPQEDKPETEAEEKAEEAVAEEAEEVAKEAEADAEAPVEAEAEAEEEEEEDTDAEVKVLSYSSVLTSAAVVGDALFFTAAFEGHGLVFRAPYAEIKAALTATTTTTEEGKEKEEQECVVVNEVHCINVDAGIAVGDYRIAGAAGEAAFFIVETQSIDTWLVGVSAVAPKKLKLSKKYADYYVIRYGMPFSDNVGLRHVLTPAIVAQLRESGVDTDDQAAVLAHVHKRTECADRKVVGALVDAQFTPWIFTSNGEVLHCARPALDLENLFMDKKGFACLARSAAQDAAGRDVANFRMRDASWDLAIPHDMAPYGAVYFDALNISRAKQRASGKVLPPKARGLERIAALPEGHGCVAVLGDHDDGMGLIAYLSNSMATISVPGDFAFASNTAPAAKIVAPEGKKIVGLAQEFKDAAKNKVSAFAYNRVVYNEDKNILMFVAQIDGKVSLQAVLL